VLGKSLKQTSLRVLLVSLVLLVKATHVFVPLPLALVPALECPRVALNAFAVVFVALALATNPY
jgi:hypothetical protein